MGNRQFEICISLLVLPERGGALQPSSSTLSTTRLFRKGRIAKGGREENANLYNSEYHNNVSRIITYRCVCWLNFREAMHSASEDSFAPRYSFISPGAGGGGGREARVLGEVEARATPRRNVKNGAIGAWFRHR